MSPDDKYVLSPKPPIETTQQPLHPKERWRANLAILVAFCAAAFTFWQGCEAHQARIDSRQSAKQARQDAMSAIEVQTETANASKNSAIESADAAKQAVSAIQGIVQSLREQEKQTQKR